MPNNPFQPTPLRPAPDPELWRQYERANKRAADQYRHMPSAAGRIAIDRHICACGGWTWHQSGVCKPCRESS